MDRLEISGLSKRFGSVQVLSQISFSVRTGEVLAVCGENGAGKSTLMHILSGNLQADEGVIRMAGSELVVRSPQEASRAGIATVYQHLSLVETLSVAENIFAGSPPAGPAGLIDRRESRKLVRDLLDRLQIDVDPALVVGSLSQIQKQMVEIAKALIRQPSLLILDEPTASLTDKECITLFGIVRELKKQGTSIIYISHRLDEIFQLADRVCVLKDGVNQGVYRVAELTKAELVKKMVGREIRRSEHRSSTPGTTLLEARSISGQRCSSVNFALHAGEILGVAGLTGSGRTEILRAIFGLDPINSGEVLINGSHVDITSPADAIARGVGFVSEQRRIDGIFPGMSIRDNVAIAACSAHYRLWPAAYATSVATRFRESLQIKSSSIAQRIDELSGGNQQKVVIAKWLTLEPRILLLDEPTHGIDVGAKQEIYEIIRAFVQRGNSVLVVSSDLPELISLADNIMVIRNGTVAGQVVAAGATEQQIIALATGVSLN